MWCGEALLNRADYHDACNDLAVAIGSVRAFIDGKLAPSEENLVDVLEALEHVAVLMARTRTTGQHMTGARENLLQAIVEGSPYAKVLVDGTGRIVLVNAQTENL